MYSHYAFSIVNIVFLCPRRYWNLFKPSTKTRVNELVTPATLLRCDIIIISLFAERCYAGVVLYRKSSDGGGESSRFRHDNARGTCLSLLRRETTHVFYLPAVFARSMKIIGTTRLTTVCVHLVASSSTGHECLDVL